MTSRGGIPPRRPDQTPQQYQLGAAGLDQQAVIAPGSNSPRARRAHVVVIWQPTDGLFDYFNQPASGNPPVLSITSPFPTTDPSGNAIPVQDYLGNTVQQVMAIGESGGAHWVWSPGGEIYLVGETGHVRLYSAPPVDPLIWAIYDQTVGYTLAANPGMALAPVATAAGSVTLPAGLTLITLPIVGYSATPALGTLLTSVAGVSGTDTFGNHYPAGLFGPLLTTAATAVQPGTAETAETWHSIPLASGFTATAGFFTPAYRLTPDGDVELSGSVSGTISGVTAFSTALPAAYTPSSKVEQAAGVQSSGGTSAGVTPRVALTTGGILQMAGLANGAAVWDLDGLRFRLS